MANGATPAVVMSSSSPSSSALTRRRRILNHQHSEERHERKTTKQINKGQNQANDLFTKFYLVVLVFLTGLVVCMVLLFYFKSMFRAKRRQQIPRPIVTVMTLFPSDVSPKHDFDKARFFQNWVFATPENKQARLAVQDMIVVGRTMHRAFSVSTRFSMQTWEQEDVDNFIANNATTTCGGGDFESLYKQADSSLQFDLVLWCLMASGTVSGYVPMKYAKTMGQKGSIALSKIWRQQKLYNNTQQNVMVLSDEDERVVSDSILLFRQSCVNDTTMACPNDLAKQTLDWIMKKESASLQHDPVAFRQDLDRYLYEQVQLQKRDNPASWVILHCSDPSNEEEGVVLARHCRDEDNCCDIHVPQVKDPPPKRRIGHPVLDKALEDSLRS